MSIFGSSKTRYSGSKNWFVKHSLSLVLAVMMVVQTSHALWAGHSVWLKEPHNKLRGWPTDFWIWWSWEYNVSLVADTFGVLLIVLLSKWFYEQGSAESKNHKEK